MKFGQNTFFRKGAHSILSALKRVLMRSICATDLNLYGISKCEVDFWNCQNKASRPIICGAFLKRVSVVLVWWFDRVKLICIMGGGDGPETWWEEGFSQQTVKNGVLICRDLQCFKCKEYIAWNYTFKTNSPYLVDLYLLTIETWD